MKRINPLKALALLVFCSVSILGWNQATGVIRFGIDLEGEMRIDKRYFEIRLADTLLINQSIATLPAGAYSGEVWAPGFEIQKIDFVIEPDQRTDLMVYMKYSEEYLAYKKNMPIYLQKEKQLKVRPLIFTSFFTAGTFFVTERMTHYHRAIYKGVDAYPRTTSAKAMGILKDEMRLNSDKYNMYRILFYSGIVLTSTSIAFSFYGSRKFKRKYHKPTYNRISPFHNQLVLGLGANGINITLQL